MDAIALFVVLAIVMYVTRKVDWYALTSVELSKLTPHWGNNVQAATSDCQFPDKIS